MTDLTPALDLLTRYRASFDKTAEQFLRRWMAEGADLERDIMPVLRHWTQKKPDIYSPGFFTEHVTKARLTRQAGEREPASGPEADARRAKRIAFLTRKLGQRHPTDERWLREYETKNGAVSIG
jgi:hypothetical protein